MHHPFFVTLPTLPTYSTLESTCNTTTSTPGLFLWRFCRTETKKRKRRKRSSAVDRGAGGSARACSFPARDRPTLSQGLETTDFTYCVLMRHYISSYFALSELQNFSHGLRFALQNWQGPSSIKDDFFVYSSIVMILTIFIQRRI